MKLLSALIVFVMAAAPASSFAETKTVGDRLREYGAVVRERWAPHFEAAGVSYPPRRLTMIGFKQERVLEIYAADGPGQEKFIRAYPVLAASGLPGPKLREGDKQVPEGVYALRELNPNSLFHLSLWIDYPNAFERARAAEDGRTNPGGEIMIHGDAVSKGCLAMGDPASEDLFVLAALTGIENVKVILAPVDFREKTAVQLPPRAPAWLPRVYEQLQAELARYRRP